MFHANDRVLGGLLSLVICACSCSSDKPKSKGEPSVTSPSEVEKEDTPIDVGFLVEACAESGFSAESCQCVGDEARTILGKSIVDKMRSAPADEDPALEGYYEGAEIAKIMELVEASTKKCGVEG
jgi:hypothetical protein